MQKTLAIIIFILSLNTTIQSQHDILMEVSLQYSNITEAINLNGKDPKPSFVFGTSINFAKPINDYFSYSLGFGFSGVKYNGTGFTSTRNYTLRYFEIPIGIRVHFKKLFVQTSINPSFHLFNYLRFDNISDFSSPSYGNMKKVIYPMTVSLGYKNKNAEFLFGLIRNFENIIKTNTDMTSSIYGFRFSVRVKVNRS